MGNTTAGAAPALKLEVGKAYRTRAGERAVVTSGPNRSGGYCVDHHYEDGFWFHEANGLWSGDDESCRKYDLIAPWSDEEPVNDTGEETGLADMAAESGSLNIRAIEPEGIDATLEERGNRYGSFTEHAIITQRIKRAYLDSPNWEQLPDFMKEALEMVAHKIGRILNGDPMYADSWHDIIGYTKLVENELTKTGGQS
jgi:hypothetical protein